ncbi:MAG: hypothetical protein NC394_06480 [Bacteroides sp.]|nr:hypothetical protein [Bacteroides sp.]
MKKRGAPSFLAAAAAAAVCILLITDSEGMINAAKNSVAVCLNVIIPSLFAFMVFSQLVVSSNAADILFYPLYKLSRFWFRGSRREFGIFMLSLVGGYPVGIKLLREEAADNENYTSVAEKMLCYCYCGSPAFIIQIAGLSVLGSSKAGLLAYISNAMACLTAAVILNLTSKKRSSSAEAPLPRVKISLRGVTDSIDGAVRSLGVICGTILAFNIALELLSFTGIMGLLETAGADKLVRAAFEISNLSLFTGSGYGLLPLFAALTSFGGLCIIMQTATLSGGRLRLGKFMLWRIPVSALSAVYCYILTLFFPISVETEAALPTMHALSSVNPICSVCLTVMTFILLKGLNKENNENIR